MKKFTMLYMATIVLAMGSIASAAVTVAYDPGTLYQTSALTGYSTYGDDMVGMGVTVYYTGGSETVSWTADGSGAGKAVGTGWSLYESGDTWSSAWTFNTGNLMINRLVINAAPGDTVFDVYSPAGSTSGSESGKAFTATSSLNIVATYRNNVALTGFAPVGDLWALLDIQFNNTSNFGILQFYADTDSAASAGDVNPVIPAPGAILLAGIGTTMVGWLRRHRVF